MYDPSQFGFILLHNTKNERNRKQTHYYLLIPNNLDIYF